MPLRARAKRTPLALGDALRNTGSVREFAIDEGKVLAVSLDGIADVFAIEVAVGADQRVAKVGCHSRHDLVEHGRRPRRWRVPLARRLAAGRSATSATPTH